MQPNLLAVFNTAGNCHINGVTLLLVTSAVASRALLLDLLASAVAHVADFARHHRAKRRVALHLNVARAVALGASDWTSPRLGARTIAGVAHGFAVIRDLGVLPEHRFFKRQIHAILQVAPCCGEVALRAPPPWPPPKN